MAKQTEAAPLPPMDVTSIACSRAFADDNWRDANGRDLYDAIRAQVGDERAVKLWREACSIYDDTHNPDGWFDKEDPWPSHAEIEARADAAALREREELGRP